MAKAVLVMDMPEKCTDCVVGSYGICRFSQEIILRKSVGRPDWCPLRELPERATEMTDADDLGVDYVSGTMDGWNACLDEILKERDADGTS